MKNLIKKTNYYYGLEKEKKCSEGFLHIVITIYDFLNYYTTPTEEHTRLLKNVLSLFCGKEYIHIPIAKFNPLNYLVDCKNYLNDIKVFLEPKITDSSTTNLINQIELSFKNNSILKSNKHYLPMFRHFLNFYITPNKTTDLRLRQYLRINCR